MKRTVSLFLFLIAIICFLLPWIGYSFMGTNILTESGLDMVIGKQYTTPLGDPSLGPTLTVYKLEPKPLVIGALIVVILGILVSIMKWNKASIVRGILGITGVVLLIALQLNHQTNPQWLALFQLHYSLGYWFAMSAFALAAVMNFVPNNLRIRFKKASDMVKTQGESTENKPSNG